MELEIKHLTPYLPYGLKMIFESKGGRVITLTGITHQGPYGVTITDGHGSMWLKHCGFKPILHPLSDLTKEITHNGETFSPIEALNQEFFDGDEYEIKFYPNGCYFYVSRNGVHCVVPQGKMINKLAEWHFDFQGLIEAGLAIDVNMLDVCPQP